MRFVLIVIAAAVLSACGAKDDAPPERTRPAGQVLGGEVTDDMLPLDTARSVSPAGRSGPDAAAGGSNGSDPADPADALPDLPVPQLTDGTDTPAPPAAAPPAASPGPSREEGA